MPLRQRSMEFASAPPAATRREERLLYICPSAVKMWQRPSMCVLANPW
jgi:hypothetical protein